jgi:hypothetical protein
MANENIAGVPVPGTIAKKVERSAAHPAITIEQCLKFVAEFYKNFRNDFAKRADILRIIENAHPRHLAAAGYYLFLNRIDDTYQVSEFYKAVVTASDKDRQSLLLKSFKAPKLNSALIEKFDGDEIPTELETHLSLFYGITNDAAPLAAEVFIKNAKFCGVLNEKNFLNVANFNAKSDDSSIADTPPDIQAQEEKNAPNIATQNPANLPPDTGQNQKLIPEMVNSEKIKIRITGGRFVYLEYPINLTSKDIDVLQKQIEQLRIIAESA